MTLDDIAARKRIEYKQKLKALEIEFNEWEKRSNENEPFEKHNTQIRSIEAHLSPWNEAIREELDSFEQIGTDALLKNCKATAKLILTEHRVWDYFRRKFIQRKDENFHRYLKVADEFAWACYEPIQKATESELKEPPLVFFNGGASPFSVSRERTFQSELVDGLDANSDITKEEITRLPISVVGIPWDQISHMAEASVIGHEVGHIVENDFDLTEDLRRLLEEGLTNANATDERKDAWNQWLAEIFADLYGCLSVGPAYAGTLLDYLANEKFEIERQKRLPTDWTSYPTDLLRMKIILQILEKMNFTDAIKNYVDICSEYKSKMSVEFENDIRFIVERLLDGEFEKLGKKKLTDVFDFTKGQQKQVEDNAKLIRENTSISMTPLQTNDIRVLFAANRISFEQSPQQHIDNNYDDLVLTHIINKVIDPGVRSGYVRTSSEQKLQQYRKTSKESIKRIIKKTYA